MMKQDAEAAAQAIEGAFSNAFYKVSTMEGFDKDKYKNFWEYLKDVADDFLKSIWQSMMRAISDNLSKKMMEALIEWVMGLSFVKDIVAQQDAAALAAAPAKEAALAAETASVSTLATAYWMLAAAKIAAGVGGASSGSYSEAGIGSSTQNVAHQGGLIMHQGGVIPRYHSGGGPLSSDERLIIGQIGEGVVSRKGVKALEAINEGKVSGGSQPMIINISAMDVKSFRDFARKHSDTFIEMFTRDMRIAGSSRTAIKAYS